MAPPAEAPPLDRQEKPPKRRRVLRIVTSLLASLIILPLIWVGAQLVLRRPQPKLLYTEGDLPKLPSIEENGWEVLKSEIPKIGELKRPTNEVAGLCDAKATFEDRWNRAEMQAQKLTDVADEGATKRALEMMDKAAARPQFADGCPIGVTQDCPRALQLLVLHEIQEAVVLHNALNDHWPEAFSRAEHTLRADTRFLPSSRSALSFAVARAQVLRSLTLVNVLLDGAEIEKKAGRAPDEKQLVKFVREIDPLVNAVHAEDMDPKRLLVVEYVFSARAILLVNDSPHGFFSRTGPLFFDLGHTLEMLNQRFEQYGEFAHSNATSAFPTFPRGRMRSLHNSTGYLILDGVGSTLENQIPAIVKDRELFEKNQKNLVERLRKLMNPQ